MLDNLAMHFTVHFWQTRIDIFNYGKLIKSTLIMDFLKRMRILTKWAHLHFCYTKCPSDIKSSIHSCRMTPRTPRLTTLSTTIRPSSSCSTEAKRVSKKRWVTFQSWHWGRHLMAALVADKSCRVLLLFVVFGNATSVLAFTSDSKQYFSLE